MLWPQPLPSQGVLCVCTPGCSLMRLGAKARLSPRHASWQPLLRSQGEAACAFRSGFYRLYAPSRNVSLGSMLGSAVIVPAEDAVQGSRQMRACQHEATSTT